MVTRAGPSRGKRTAKEAAVEDQDPSPSTPDVEPAAAAKAAAKAAGSNTQAPAAATAGAKPAKVRRKAAAGSGSPEASAKQPKAGRSKAAAAAAAPAAGADKPPYYLVKSEPEEFSIDDLEANPNQTEPWTGVRNAQARNIMRGMRLGDTAFFYHSSCKVPGIVGIAKVVKEAYPDPTSWDTSSKYHDPKSTPQEPRWWMVDWQLVRRTQRPITLQELKRHADGGLQGMALFNRPRLSVQPVTAEEWAFILGLEQQQEGADTKDKE